MSLNSISVYKYIPVIHYRLSRDSFGDEDFLRRDKCETWNKKRDLVEGADSYKELLGTDPDFTWMRSPRGATWHMATLYWRGTASPTEVTAFLPPPNSRC
jgi:hypothetical protein